MKQSNSVGFTNDIGLKGKVRLCKHINGVDVEQLPEFNNLILDVFINACYAETQIVNNAIITNPAHGVGMAARVGSGTTPPTVSDVALESPLLLSSSTSNTGSLSYNPDTDEYTITRENRIEFAPASDNYNLTEMAIYTSTTGAPSAAFPMVSRTLIKDGLGDPTTLVLSEEDILVVFYTYSMVVKRTQTFQRNIKGIPTTINTLLQVNSSTATGSFPFVRGKEYSFGARGNSFSIRPAAITFPPAFTSITSSGWSASSNSGVSSRPPVVAGTGLRQRDRIGLAFANTPAIGTLAYTPILNSYNNCFIMTFDPPFEKLNTEVIDFETLTTFTRL